MIRCTWSVNIVIWIIGDEGHQSNVTRNPATYQETASNNLNTDDTYNLNYTEKEFIKEFKDEGEDEEQNYENDPRLVISDIIIQCSINNIYVL